LEWDSFYVTTALNDQPTFGKAHTAMNNDPAHVDGGERPNGNSGGPQDEQVKRSHKNPKARPVMIKPTAGPSRPRRRHFAILASFILSVVVPLLAIVWYLYMVADDQYASTVGFSVRTEETSSPVEILGNISNLSSSSSSDTDILYEFIQSQELVEKVNAQLDLAAIYSKPENDPYFAYDPTGAIEDLVDYWRRMVKVYYDSGTGLIEVRVQAFDPQDAQDVARAIFDESSKVINELSAIARADATRYASSELERAVERLKEARRAVTLFRARNQIVDPSADIQGQMGLLNTLQAQLAEALIELDLLMETTSSNDPRLSQAQRKIDVITRRIEEERKKFGFGEDESTEGGYAGIVSDYESLSVDLEFAEQAYTASLTAFDIARSDAQRQSRYLAAYIKPTLAQSSQFPQREILAAMAGLFLFLAWSLLVLVYYSIRDRR
jgi:capsular polysaccharide transport system permease protein